MKMANYHVWDTECGVEIINVVLAKCVTFSQDKWVYDNIFNFSLILILIWALIFIFSWFLWKFQKLPHASCRGSCRGKSFLYIRIQQYCIPISAWSPIRFLFAYIFNCEPFVLLIHTQYVHNIAHIKQWILYDWFNKSGLFQKLEKGREWRHTEQSRQYN